MKPAFNFIGESAMVLTCAGVLIFGTQAFLMLWAGLDANASFVRSLWFSCGCVLGYVFCRLGSRDQREHPASPN